MRGEKREPALLLTRIFAYLNKQQVEMNKHFEIQYSLSDILRFKRAFFKPLN